MTQKNNEELTAREKDELVRALADQLLLLRARLNLSQAELAKMAGMTRQSYSNLENGMKEMSWATYLSLICLFDNHAATRQMLRESKAYPSALLARWNEGKDPDEGRARGIAGIPVRFTEQLDDKALHTIRTVVMLEYARCTGTRGETVLKAFDGVELRLKPEQKKS